MFPYSERPGTRALGIDHVVPQEEKHRRVARLTELSEERHRAFMERYIGSRRQVLWETSHEPGSMHGLTDNYIRVVAPERPELYNTITEVTLGDFDPEETASLTAEI